MVVWAAVPKKTMVSDKRQMLLKHQRSRHACKRLLSAATNKDPIFNLRELGGFGTRGGENLDGVPCCSGHLDVDVNHPVRDVNGIACPRQWNFEKKKKKKLWHFFKLDVFLFLFFVNFLCVLYLHMFLWYVELL